MKYIIQSLIFLAAMLTVGAVKSQDIPSDSQIASLSNKGLCRLLGIGEYLAYVGVLPDTKISSMAASEVKKRIGTLAMKQEHCVEWVEEGVRDAQLGAKYDPNN